MTIFMMLFRKMNKNRWLVISLLSGMMISTMLTSSLPIYKESILQRMLIKELDQFYMDTWKYPGSLSAKLSLSLHDDEEVTRYELLQQLDEYWEQQIIEERSFEIHEFIRERSTRHFSVRPVTDKESNSDSHQVDMVMRTNIEEHVDLVEGKYPSAAPVDGVYEGMVTEALLVQYDMELGDTFISENSIADGVKVKIVGIIEQKDLNDRYWTEPLSEYSKSIIINEQLFNEIVQQEIIPLSSASWLANVDYTKLSVASADLFLQKKQQIDNYYKQTIQGFTPTLLAAMDIFSQYKEKEERLSLLLLSLNIPLLVLVIFYVYMVSGLLVERQLPEMAVLRSRGASRKQIFLLYLIESVILACIAFTTGPFLGAFVTKILGSSDSFLSFVNRGDLNVSLSFTSFAYSGIAAVFVIIVNLVPMLLSMRVSIVDQKRDKARERKLSFWFRYGIDFILLGLGCYGLYHLNRKLETLLALETEGLEMNIDPILFVIPFVFITGLGLVLLRLYPYALHLVYRIGKNAWTPPFYSSLLQVSRRTKQYQLLMLFLILTVAIGIFSTSAARTLNDNMEEQIWYRNGSEIVLSQQWTVDPASLQDEEEQVRYIEPPYETFSKLEGIDSSARVFSKEDAYFWAEEGNGRAELMGIVTDEFGRTSWMKDGLLPHHFYEYLNVMATDPYAVLISDTLAKSLNVSEGDKIEVGWVGTEKLQVTVYGILDYFPSFNPNIPNPSQENADSMLIVGHLETIQNELGLEPYDVWVKLNKGMNKQAFIDQLTEKDIHLVGYKDTAAEIIQSRNDPFRLAMNGVMSFGFILSLCVTFFGFLLYWILSLQRRILQFGILRAMGITFRQMIAMLTLEQLLTSGVGIFVGMITGAVTSFLFVPMFQTVFNPSQIVPPFEVMIKGMDILILSIFILLMMMIALLTLGYYLKRIKIHQALRLGED
ncbi:putative ABC transport system permease protein [Gracilibacillus ureilyticus]|uniref:Putative ABC transport system permease protein n=1 Tax=Gracilibacillus ureilyticus TaxID=531814 RepID=A0A1H9Q6J9_9BACI|nr:FtsX-like permease family protein [Gracilibacillus ureilyticus]SER56091.1 putative ABC transport system permease protein [Gracilibacillus ureilyticus]